MREGWKKELLKDACKVFTDGNWIQTKDQSTEGIRLVQTGNIGFGYFRNKKDKSRYISEETFKRLFSGSKTGEITYKSRVPLLIIHP